MMYEEPKFGWGSAILHKSTDCLVEQTGAPEDWDPTRRFGSLTLSTTFSTPCHRLTCKLGNKRRSTLHRSSDPVPSYVQVSTLKFQVVLLSTLLICHGFALTSMLPVLERLIRQHSRLLIPEKAVVKWNRSSDRSTSRSS